MQTNSPGHPAEKAGQEGPNTASIQQLHHSQKGSVRITLPKGGEASLTGLCRILMLHGRITALGRVLTPQDSRAVIVTVPQCRPALQIVALEASQFDVLSDNPAIADISRIAPTGALLWSREGDATFCTSLGPPPMGAPYIPSQWTLHGLQEQRVVCVLGSRHAGKSTFVRFLANSLLSQPGPPPYILDTDPGQPLCGAPGTLGLYEAPQERLLASSFDQCVPVCVRYYGSNSPAIDKPLFQRCVRGLYEHFCQLPRGRPLIINTTGWVKGYGRELLLHILDICAVECFIVLGEVDEQLQAALAREKRHGIYLPSMEPPVMDQSVSAGEMRDLLTTYRLRVDASSGWVLKPLLQLDVCITRYDIDFDAFVLLQPDIELGDALLALNGAVVGVVACANVASVQECRQKTAEQVPVIMAGEHTVDIVGHGELIGLAVVRNFDLAQRRVLLTGPVRQADVLRARHAGHAVLLVRGQMALPTYELLDPSTRGRVGERSVRRGHVPYVSRDSLTGTGRQPWRARYNIVRGVK